MFDIFQKALFRTIDLNIWPNSTEAAIGGFLYKKMFLKIS